MKKITFTTDARIRRISRLWRGCIFWLLLTVVGYPVTCLSGQDSRGSDYYDRITFQLYHEQEWRELGRVARQAMREDFDYYYLRMRLGISLFERGRYQQAARHFRGALSLSPGEPVAREYLYYALLYGGRGDEARLFSPSVQKREWGMGGLFAESGYKKNNELTPVRDMYYWSVGLRHRLGRHLELSHTYQQLVQEFYFDENWWPNVEGEPPVVREQDHRQWEYFLGGGWQFSRGWRITGGGRLVWTKGLDGSPREQVGMVGVRKDFPGLTLRLSAGWSDFCRSEQRHYAVGLVGYPLGNTNLYYHARLIGRMDKEVTHHLFCQQVGFRLGKRFWVDGQYDFGKINCFVEYDGAIAYNLNDWTTGRYGGGLQYWLGGRHALMLRFQREDKWFSVNDFPYRFDNLILVLEMNLD